MRKIGVGIDRLPLERQILNPKLFVHQFLFPLIFEFEPVWLGGIEKQKTLDVIFDNFGFAQYITGVVA